MYSLKKMTQKISKTYTLSFPKAAHSLEAQDQGGSKCRQIEVGARRVPRLLVYHMYSREVTTEHGKWKPPGGRK